MTNSKIARKISKKNLILGGGVVTWIVLHNLSIWSSIISARKKKFLPLQFETYSKEQLDSDAEKFPFPKDQGKITLNKGFLKQLRALFNILIPNLTDKTVGLLILHTIFLLFRTGLSVYIAEIDGLIVRDLVNNKPKEFFKGIGLWFAIAIPATYTNSMIRYLQSKLSIAFRSRLVNYCQSLYLDENMSFYKLLNLDRRIEGPDQYITSDIAKFSESLSGLYSSLGKPLFDTFIFQFQLMRSIGAKPGFLMIAFHFCTIYFLRSIAPQFGKLAAIQTQMEGEYRGAHTRLITNSEEIAFYHGGKIEEGILNRAYTKLVKHINYCLKIRIPYNMMEDYVIKYFWSLLGLIACAIPALDPKSKLTRAQKLQQFVTNKRILLALGDAGGRLMYSYKDLAELAGYTDRVYKLVATLHSLRKNSYQVAEGAVKGKENYHLDNIHGQIHEGKKFIELKNVPIVAPNPKNPNGGDILVKKLSFKVKKGEHLMITGPNGVGKSAISRVMRGLWPVFEGELSKPDFEEMIYVPQKPYLTLGTLRDQIIYPHSHKQMKNDNITDEDLMKILELVYLDYIPEREGGFDTVKEWKDVFSGGEKQRINLARLFYHKPKFAVLDECTSAVSSDVEGLMYSEAKNRGMTLITISHRPSLFKYHSRLLTLIGDKERGWELTELGSNSKRYSNISKEIKDLQGKINNAQIWKSRLEEINAQLQLAKPPKALSKKLEFF